MIADVVKPGGSNRRTFQHADVGDKQTSLARKHLKLYILATEILPKFFNLVLHENQTKNEKQLK